LNAKIVDSPRQHLVHIPVPAAGAKVRLMLQLFLPLKALVECLGLGVHDFVH
jgi:hypothetical protein